MLMLLPPSEGKTAPDVGAPVDLARLSHPELTATRRSIGDALVKASARADAAALLGAGASLADEVKRNTGLWSQPAAPAAHVYTGVLYDAASMTHWDAETLARASERIRIVSALWAALSPADAIPAYRLPMTTTLPGIGKVAAAWRAQLRAALDALATGVVVDARSSSYANVWKPGSDVEWLTVRVEREGPAGRTVVSHFAKHTRGLLAGRIAAAPIAPADADTVAEVAAGLIGAAGSSTGMGTVIGVELGAPAPTRALTLVIA